MGTPLRRIPTPPYCFDDFPALSPSEHGSMSSS
jgi:hypothetical protein